MLLAPLIVQYNLDAATKAQQIVSLTFDPKMFSKLMPDIYDPIRLANSNAQTLVKSGLESKQYNCDYVELCPEFIARVQIYGDKEIFKYLRIILNFNEKIAMLTKQILSTSTAIIDMLKSGLLMTLFLQIDLMLQIVHLVLVDVFWTVFSMALKGVWMAYAATLMSGSFGFWASPATGAMVIMLAGVQLGIEAQYLAYLFVKIGQYIINTVIAILQVLITFIAWIANLAIQLILQSERLLEQIAGLAGTIPCIPVIKMAQTNAIAQLQARYSQIVACLATS